MIDSAQSHVCNFGEGVGIGHWIAVFFFFSRARVITNLPPRW